MEDIILDEVSWDMAMSGELSEADYNKSFEEMAEYLMNMYEDLKEYENLCFWDTDCMLLDDMGENEIVGSV